MPPDDTIDRPPRMTDELDQVPVHLVQGKRKADGTIIRQPPIVPAPEPVTIEESEERTVIKIDRLIVPDVPVTEPSVPPVPLIQHIIPAIPPVVTTAPLAVTPVAPVVVKPTPVVVVPSPSVPTQPQELEDDGRKGGAEQPIPKVPSEPEMKPEERRDEDKVVDEYSIRRTEEPEPASKLPPPVPIRKLRPLSPPEKETTGIIL